jgi:hypothetical protein
VTTGWSVEADFSDCTQSVSVCKNLSIQTNNPTPWFYSRFGPISTSFATSYKIRWIGNDLLITTLPDGWYEQSEEEHISRAIKSFWYEVNYGLTLEQVEERITDRNGLCDICHKPNNADGRPLYVDHYHGINQQTRGMLCHGCNLRVGVVEKKLLVGIIEPPTSIEYIYELMSEETIERYQDVIEYIEKWAGH